MVMLMMTNYEPSITYTAAARVRRKYRIFKQAKVGGNVRDRNTSILECQANMHRERKRNVSLNPAITGYRSFEPGNFTSKAFYED
jgi:hypothetical protein